MDADELRGPLRRLCQTRDRQSRGVAREHRGRRDHGFRLAGHLGLDLALLEHRLDDQIAAREISVVCSGTDARQHRVRLRLGAPATLDLAREQLTRMIPALLGKLDRAVEQHDLHARSGGDMRDSSAHHSRAEDTEAADLGPWRPRRPARELVGLPLVHEHRPHQVARHGAREQPAELLRLDSKPGVDRHLGALVNGGQDRERRGVVPHRGPRGQRRPGHEGLRRRWRAHPGTAGHTKAFAIPGLHRVRRAEQPAAGALDDLRRGRRLVHQPLAERLGGPHLRALGDQAQRLGDPDQSRQPLRATGAREQTDLHLRKADACFRLVGEDAVVTGERQLEPARRAPRR